MQREQVREEIERIVREIARGRESKRLNDTEILSERERERGKGKREEEREKRESERGRVSDGENEIEIARERKRKREMEGGEGESRRKGMRKREIVRECRSDQETNRDRDCEGERVKVGVCGESER